MTSSPLPPPPPPPPNPPRGALIVIEGLDRSGKSTQCQRLQQHLQTLGISVKVLTFPNRTTPTGHLINAYLRSEIQLTDHAIHLLFSANRWEAVPGMLADLAAGTTLVLDRYYYSGIVYSAAKGRGDLSLEWARAPEVGLPRPDLCLFLDVNPEAAGARAGFGDERYECGEMQVRVRELFYRLVGMVDGADIRVIEAWHDVKRVEGEIWEKVEKILQNRETMGPLEAVS